MRGQKLLGAAQYNQKEHSLLEQQVLMERCFQKI